MSEYTLIELPKPDGYISAEPTNNICFNAEGGEMLRLDKDGFHYKGQTIDDAGEAHRLFMTWLNKANGG